jgi:hypothetical protein
VIWIILLMEIIFHYFFLFVLFCFVLFNADVVESKLSTDENKSNEFMASAEAHSQMFQVYDRIDGKSIQL